MPTGLRTAAIAAGVILATAMAPAVADQIVYFANGKAIQVKSVESQDKFTILEMEGGGKIGVPTEQIARIEILAPITPSVAPAFTRVAQEPPVAAPIANVPAPLIVPGAGAAIASPPAAAQTAQAGTPPPTAGVPQPGASPGSAGRQGATQGGFNRRFSPPRAGGPMLSVGAGAARGGAAGAGGGRPGMAGRPGARPGASGPRGGVVAPPPAEGGAVALPDPDEENAPEESTAPPAEGTPGNEPSTDSGQEEEAAPPDDAPPSAP